MIVAKSQKFIDLMQKPTMVYMAVNLVNGKKYIGITAQRLEQRKRAHVKGWGGNNAPSLLHRAIKKYGEPAFHFVKIKECSSYQEALDMERFFIKEWKPEYNMTQGGEGCLGFKMPESVLRKRGERESSLKGKKRPPEVIAKMSAANKGRKLNLSDEARAVRVEQAKRMLERKRALGRPASEKQRKHASSMALVRRRAVICINDGREFEAASYADAFYGLSSGTASDCARNKIVRIRKGQLTFRYKKDVGEIQ